MPGAQGVIGKRKVGLIDMSQRSRIGLLYSLFAVMFGLGVLIHFTPYGYWIVARPTRAERLPSREIASKQQFEWIPFSSERFQTDLSSGCTVLVFFHADWDVASNYMKYLLKADAIERVLLRHQVVVLDANCSDKDPPEFEVLQKLRESMGYSRKVVPVVAIFAGRNSTATELNGYSEKELLAAIERGNYPVRWSCNLCREQELIAAIERVVGAKD